MLSPIGKICLASASPRRRQLLHQIGVEFTIDKSNIDETPGTSETPVQYVTRMASEKANAVYLRRLAENRERLPVLGADTEVVLNKTVLGKPKDRNHARAMLVQLSGKTHEVLTAISLIGENGTEWHAISTSRVTFAELDDELISNYVASGEADDKAGGYGIQGIGAVFITRLEGSYSAVVGLPLYELVQLLNKMKREMNER